MAQDKSTELQVPILEYLRSHDWRYPSLKGCFGAGEAGLLSATE
jgi:hypothetical protein